MFLQIQNGVLLPAMLTWKTVCSPCFFQQTEAISRFRTETGQLLCLIASVCSHPREPSLLILSPPRSHPPPAHTSWTPPSAGVQWATGWKWEKGRGVPTLTGLPVERTRESQGHTEKAKAAVRVLKGGACWEEDLPLPLCSSPFSHCLSLFLWRKFLIPEARLSESPSVSLSELLTLSLSVLFLRLPPCLPVFFLSGWHFKALYILLNTRIV